MLIFLVLIGLQFVVGVVIVYNGVWLIFGDLVLVFQGISQKLILDFILVVDCVVFFIFSFIVVVVGFISFFVGGLVGMFLFGGLGMVLIIFGMVLYFFCGGMFGVFVDKLGGKCGCIIVFFIGGIFLVFLLVMLLLVFGNFGFENSIFVDFDFVVWGIIIGNVFIQFGQIIIYLICLVLFVVLLVFFCFCYVQVVGNMFSYEEFMVKQKNE